MLKTIKRKRHRTHLQNVSTITKQVDKINEDVLLPLLVSPYLREGVYGFELISNQDFCEQFFLAPSLFRSEVGVETYRDYHYLSNDLKNLSCYNIELTKPSFLPLHTEEPFALLSHLSDLGRTTKSDIYIQFLFTKRPDRWETNVLQQYEAYKDGNDYPAEGAFARKVQQGLLNVVDKISGYEARREAVEEIEQKILDQGYRFEMRIIVSANDNTLVENEIREILKELDFFNELSLVRVRNKKEFLRNFLGAKYSERSMNQLISEAELIVISTGNEAPKPKPVEQVKAAVLKSPHLRSMIELLPTGIKKERNFDQDIISAIPDAIKKSKAMRDPKTKVTINSDDIEMGSTVQRVTFDIPKGVVFSEIRNKYEDIKAILGTDIAIVQGAKPNTITFLIPCKERELVYLRELLQNPEFIKFAEEHALPFVCGIDCMYNKAVYKCLTNAPHLLVAGATNSGKSVFVNALLITLILFRKPSELRMVLIDPKKVEFIQYKNFAHVEDIITDMEEAVNTLDGLIEEMEDRYERLSKLGVRKIQHYNQKSKTKMPYIVCAIDEYNDLRMVFPEVEKRIERLGQKARAAGIHMIVATQRPDREVMTGVIKTNLPSRICFKLDNTNEYKTVFGSGIPYKNLLGLGDGVVKYVGQPEEFIRFQAPVIHLDETIEERTYENIKKAYKGETIEGIELSATPQPPPEEPIEKLKRIIANTGETRVKELQKEMGIAMNTVHGLIKQLLDEGWLEKQGRSYVVMADEEELKKWTREDEVNNEDT